MFYLFSLHPAHGDPLTRAQVKGIGTLIPFGGCKKLFLTENARKPTYKPDFTFKVCKTGFEGFLLLTATDKVLHIPMCEKLVLTGDLLEREKKH